jgi:hypothetical protein
MDLLFALHAGILGSAGGSTTNGIGEHVEAEALVRREPWLAVGVVGSYGHFTGTNPDDDGPVMTNTVHILAGGLRAYLESKYLFLGVGALDQFRDDAGGGFQQTLAGEALHAGTSRTSATTACSSWSTPPSRDRTAKTGRSTSRSRSACSAPCTSELTGSRRPR